MLNDNVETENLEAHIERPLVLVCDLDGTLCINDQERHPYRYDEARHDAVNEPVAEVLRMCSDSRFGIDVIFVSAREEYGYDTAKEWIRHHLPWVFFREFILLMRATGDFRNDAVIKEEIYRQKIQPYYDVLLVLDDRNQVVNMWRDRLGLPCFQVAKGDF